MFSNLYTSDSCTHIETARSVFCIDDADFLPNGFISEAWILSANQTIAELQRALCLAAARTARNADFETCHLPFGFLNLNCHAVPSVSICYLAYKTGIFSISLHWIEQDFGKRRLLPVTLTRMIITVHGFTHNEAVYAARTCALPQEKNE